MMKIKYTSNTIELKNLKKRSLNKNCLMQNISFKCKTAKNLY